MRHVVRYNFLYNLHSVKQFAGNQARNLKILRGMEWKNLEEIGKGEREREEERYGGDSIYLVFFSSDLINGICGSCLRNHGASILDGRLNRGMKLSFK